MKTQPMELEKIYANHAPDKGKLSQTHKNSNNSIAKKKSY